MAAATAYNYMHSGQGPQTLNELDSLLQDLSNARYNWVPHLKLRFLLHFFWRPTEMK